MRLRQKKRRPSARRRNQRSSRSGRSNRISRGRATERRFLFRDYLDDIKGIETTKPRAVMAIYDVDLRQSEFESELSQLGWEKEPSTDGKVMNYTKDGARYSVREFSGSTEGSTAEFFHPFSSRSDADMKLRLRKD